MGRAESPAECGAAVLSTQPASTEEFIRTSARMGWSRSMVAEQLGLSHVKLSALLDGMPAVRWPLPSQSIARKLSNERRRGSCSEGLRNAAAMGRAARRANCEHFTIGEHSGTSWDVYQVWADLCSVSYSQVRRRLDRGMNILDALFKPTATEARARNPLRKTQALSQKTPAYAGPRQTTAAMGRP